MGEPEDFIIAHCVHLGLGRVEVDALRAALAARDERVRELEAELAESERIWSEHNPTDVELRCAEIEARISGDNARIATLEAELAAIRPKAEAAERRAEAIRQSLRSTRNPVSVWQLEEADRAILDACPEKGGAG